MAGTEVDYDNKEPDVVTEPGSPDITNGEVTPGRVDNIYIDPEKEKAALKKFDKWLVPVAFIFLVLSSLDRNNVSQPSISPNAS